MTSMTKALACSLTRYSSDDDDDSIDSNDLSTRMLVELAPSDFEHAPNSWPASWLRELRRAFRLLKSDSQ